MRMFACLLYLFSCIACAQEGVQHPVNSGSKERADIEEARRVGFSVLDAEDEECQKRFVVFSCQHDVAVRRRALDAELKRREAKLNDDERAQRGLEQIQRVEQKKQDRALEDAQRTPVSAERSPKITAPQSAPADRNAKAGKSLTPEDVQRAESRKAYADKQEAAKRRQQERDQRVRESSSKSKPLPATP